MTFFVPRQDSYRHHSSGGPLRVAVTSVGCPTLSGPMHLNLFFVYYYYHHLKCRPIVFID